MNRLRSTVAAGAALIAIALPLSASASLPSHGGSRSHVPSTEVDRSGAQKLFKQALSAADHGNHRRARTLLRHLTAQYPDFADAHVLLGAMSQVEGDLEVARAEYETYLARTPAGDQADELRLVLASMPQQDSNVASRR